jgi:hypothetical protein
MLTYADVYASSGEGGSNGAEEEMKEEVAMELVGVFIGAGGNCHSIELLKVYVCMHVCICIHTHTHTHIRTHTDVCIYICIYIYINCLTLELRKGAAWNEFLVAPDTYVC